MRPLRTRRLPRGPSRRRIDLPTVQVRRSRHTPEMRGVRPHPASQAAPRRRTATVPDVCPKSLPHLRIMRNPSSRRHTNTRRAALQKLLHDTRQLLRSCGHTRPIKARANATRPDTATRATAISARATSAAAPPTAATTAAEHFPLRRLLATNPTDLRHLPDHPAHPQTRGPSARYARTCDDRRTRNPGLCAGCDTRQVLIARSPDGADLCGSCSGSSLTYSCRRCGRPGDNYADGTCMACVAAGTGSRIPLRYRRGHSRTTPPLSRRTHHSIAARRAAMDQQEHSGRISARAHQTPPAPSDDVLDRFPQDHALHRLREILVCTAILPRRHEPIAQLQLWVKTMVGKYPAATEHHQAVR